MRNKNNKQNQRKGNGQRSKPAQNSSVQAQVQKAVSAALRTQTPKKNSFLGDLGQFAGNGVSKIFGLGAYTLNKNSLYNSATGTQVPFMHSTDESITFRHREYIGEISSSTLFTNQTFNVNPGDSLCFPYLSTLATNFEEYSFNGLIFEFKSTGATALVSGTNTAMGTISMVAQYRADQTSPSTKTELLNQMWSADGKTSDSFILPIECDPKENILPAKYVRSGNFVGDVKLYDHCKLNIASFGSQGANVVGELWASYEVVLRKPQLSPTGGALAALQGRGSSLTGNTLFGDTQNVTIVQSTIQGANILTDLGGVSRITFPQGTVGNFRLDVFIDGGVVVFNQPAVSVLGIQTLSRYINDTSSTRGAPLAISTSRASYSILFTLLEGVTVTEKRISFTGGVYPSASVIDIHLTELPDDF